MAAEVGGTHAVIVVGSTMIDLVTYTQRVPERGETLVGDRFAMGFGGKGANQAVMARRMGAQVKLVNRVGDDSYGAMILDNLASHGIDASDVLRVPGSSGVAPIWVEADGTNRIIIIPGANAALTAEDAAAAVRDAARVDVVVAQFETAQGVSAAAFEAARSRGARTILNPAPAATPLPELLAVTDWLIPNEVEFGVIGGHGPLAGSAAEEDAAMVAFSAAHGTRLLVTLGERGAAIVGTDAAVRRVAAPRVTAVDTTGAGDAFVGAFAWALASGHDELTAARIGCAIAADSVTRPGTQSSFAAPDAAAAIVAGVLRG